MASNSAIGGKGNAYYDLTRWDIVRLIPCGTKRLLDVGCGEGNTSAMAQKILGIEEIVGVEIHPPSAEIAKSKLSRVLIGSIEELALPFPHGYFDCIVCADVLEHTKYPWSVLGKLKLHISPGGFLVASLPNLGHIVPILKIIFDRFEYEDSGILDKTHLRFFTLHTIKKLFSEAGLQIISIKPKRSRSWKFFLLYFISFGLLVRWSAYQYLVVAQKERTA